MKLLLDHLFVRRLLMLAIPATLLVFVLAYMSYQRESEKLYEGLRFNERSVLVGKGVLDRSLGHASRDVLALSIDPAFDALLNTRTPEGIRVTSKFWIEFVRIQQVYDQVRWIDETGMERIRVNYRDGEPVITPAAELQNKHDRYYFQQASRLEKGQISFSSFDLNKEHGAIEEPRKPTIRISTPVFDQSGHRRGILVANFIGQRMLDRLRQIDGSLWLVNAEGYWLLGQSSDDEWGFMYQRPDLNMEKLYPEAWQAIQLHDFGEVETKTGFWIYQTIYPFLEMTTGVSAEITSSADMKQSAQVATSWKLIHFVPRAIYERQINNLTQRILVYSIFALAVFYFSAWRIALARRGEIAALDEAKQAQAETSTLMDQFPDPMIVVNADGRIVRVNQATSEFFGYSRERLLGMLVEELMPEPHRKAHAVDRSRFNEAPHKRVMAGGEAFTALLANGSERKVSINLNSFSQQDGTQLITAALRDITEELDRRRALQESEQRLALATASGNIGVWQYNIDEGRLLWDDHMYEIYGLNPEDTMIVYEDWVKVLHPEDRDSLLAKIEKLLEEEGGLSEEFRIIRPDGEVRWIHAHAIIIRDQQGQAVRMIGVNLDITEQKEHVEMLRRNEEQLRYLLDNSPVGVRIARKAGSEVVYANPAYERLINVGRGEAIGEQPGRYYVNEEDYQRVLDQLKEGMLIRDRMMELDIPGIGTRWAMASYIPMEYKEEPAVLAWFVDITRLKQQQEALEQLSQYDALTGLPNRLLLAERLTLTMSQAMRRGQMMAVVFLDLDGFKEINDQYGHEIGDEVLKSVSGRMKGMLRDFDTIARFGGDEFVALVGNLDDRQSVEPLLKRLLAAASEPVSTEGLSLQVSASIGVSFFPQKDEVDTDRLIRQADKAMYQAKRAGKNRYYFYRQEH